LDKKPHCQQQGKFRYFQFLPPQIKLILIYFTLFLDLWQAKTGKNIKNIEKNGKNRTFSRLPKGFKGFLVKEFYHEPRTSGTLTNQHEQRQYVLKVREVSVVRGKFFVSFLMLQCTLYPCRRFIDETGKNSVGHSCACQVIINKKYLVSKYNTIIFFYFSYINFSYLKSMRYQNKSVSRLTEKL